MDRALKWDGKQVSALLDMALSALPPESTFALRSADAEPVAAASTSWGHIFVI